MKKKSVAVITFLAEMILFGFAPIRADTASTVASGSSGSLTWVLDNNGKLTISDKGKMDGNPWFDYRL